MSILDEYADLMARVKQGERAGSSERDEDELLEQMDTLWYRMTPAEREQARKMK